MRRPVSLTRRLIITLTAGAVVLWLLSTLATAVTLRARLDEAFDGGLRETAERLLPLALDGFRGVGEEAGERHEHEVPMFDAGGDEYIVYQVRSAEGAVLLRSHDAPKEGFDVLLVDGFATLGGWRIYTIGARDRAAFINVAERLDHRAESLLSSILTLLLPIALLIPLSAIGIYFAVRAGLRPVRALSDQIGRRHAANLTPIDTDELPVELRPIAESTQALIARLKAAFEAERAFAANSAHELRTPIAGSLAQTQLLISELGIQPARTRALQVEESLKRLRQLAEKLLELSRADAGIAPTETPTDLLPALRLIVTDATRGAGRSGGVQLVLAPGADLVASIDVDAFGIVMRNLVGNAVLHGDAGRPVTVAVRGRGVIEVINSGVVVPADQLGQLTERFVRGVTDKEGTGLGLAIVKTIVEQVGGTLELLSPAPGREDGFCARVRFAAQPRP